MKLATLCYVRAGGKTLMLHRTKRPHDMHAGKWNGLGGKLDPGETPEECVIREVWEESGLRIVKPELKGLLTFPSFDGNEDWYAFVFVARAFRGELIDSTEGVLAWIDDDALPDLNLWEGDPIFLRWLEQDRFFSGKFVYQQGKLAKHEVVFYARGDSVGEAQPSTVKSASSPESFVPRYVPVDDTYCWMCEGPVVKRHCKIVCQVCGFTRDCSDP
jgi:8-oxo-dGTP diphosphatase